MLNVKYKQIKSYIMYFLCDFMCYYCDLHNKQYASL